MPDDPTALLTKAQAFFRNGEPRQALQLVRRAHNQHPENVQVLLFLGACHGRLGEPNEAAHCFRRALAIDATLPSGHFNLAIALGELNDLEGAAAECRRAVELRPHYFEAYHALGNFCVQLGALEEAVDSYKKALSINPNAKVTHCELAGVLAKLHRLEASLMEYDAAIAIDNDFAEAYEDRGSILRALGRFQESLESYRIALSINPGSARSLFHLGKFSLAIESARRAISLAGRGTRLDGRLRSLYQVLSDSMIAIKRSDEAVSFFETATKDHPHDAHLHLLLGRAYLEESDMTRALGTFSEAHRLAPNDKLAACYLAQLGESDSSNNEVQAYVKDLFDDYARRFDEDLLENLGYKVPWLIHEAFFRHTTIGDSSWNILDLGCGTGLCGPPFAEIKQRLVGIDLSSEMVKEAGRLGVYDELIVGDIVKAMTGMQPSFELVIAADTVVYIRDLAPVFAAVNGVLRPGGLWIFSIESSEGSDVSVRASIRVAHSEQYILGLAATESLEELEIADAVLRYDGGRPIHGKIVVLRKPTR
jgi:predicted TPR repeat methyltransferase